MSPDYERELGADEFYTAHAGNSPLQRLPYGGKT